MVVDFMNCSKKKKLRKNEIVREKIGEKMIAKCLEPKNYVGHSSEIVDRVLNSMK